MSTVGQRICKETNLAYEEYPLVQTIDSILLDYSRVMNPKARVSIQEVHSNQRALLNAYGYAFNAGTITLVCFDVILAYFKEFNTGAFEESYINREAKNALLSEEDSVILITLNSIFTKLARHSSKSRVMEGYDYNKLNDILGSEYDINAFVSWVDN